MPLWVVYDAISGTIGGVINDIFVIVSAIVGIIRFDKTKKLDLQNTTESFKAD